MLDPRIAQLLDKQELAELTMRYCRGVDRGDRELIQSCYHPDGQDDHGPNMGICSPAEFAERIVPIVRSFAAWQHSLGGQLFDLHGDEAFGETYFTFHSVGEEDSQDLSSFGRYLDHFQRRGGQWRIYRRTVVLDWRGEYRAHRQDLGGWVRGLPNRNDVSYDIVAATSRNQTD